MAADRSRHPDAPFDAGDLGAWLTTTRLALRGERDAEVPCGDCAACCTSSQFVHIAPDESDALAHIPPALLFPAPFAPPGHVVLGYDEHGHCPMLRDGACSIYEHRPRTCRTYDCRVFAATGVAPDEQHTEIARRARRWTFAVDPDDRARANAPAAAAAFIERHRDELPGAIGAGGATQRAALAVEIHELFLDGEPTVDDVARACVMNRRHPPDDDHRPHKTTHQREPAAPPPQHEEHDPHHGRL